MLSLPPELARDILDAAPDAIVIVDGSGTVRFANRQVTVLFGYAHDELVGQSIEQLVPERMRARHGSLRVGYMKAGEPRPMGQGLELSGRRKDGSEFPVEISLSPIVDGQWALAAAAIRDVTDRKRVEAELIAARSTADRANSAKSRFLATASHDLRQPLQSLALLNGSLRRMVAMPEAKDVLLQQEQAIASMARLLNALLDISKLESGAVKPEIEDFPIGVLLARLGQEFAGIAASKALQLRVEPSADLVRSDPSLFEQVIRNLLANAIKYTRAGFVELRARRIGPSVVVSVRDTGIGIPKDQLACIFDEFFQVGVSDNSSREGYGLGLSIVQRVARLLNLGLDVSSEPGAGSTFTVTVPAAEGVANVPLERPLPPVERARGGCRIVLVEDDAAVRNATRLLLTVEGHSVTAVATLDDAVRAFRGDGPADLVITDYHLANGETGTQVIDAARAAFGARMKAILITGDTSSAVNQLPRDPGVRFASKPVATDELLRLIRDLIGG